ncbi:MAG: MYG1 family protein [Archaeoglobaceae archaeon]
MKIVVHSGKAHLDDLLATAIALTVYPTATVVRGNDNGDIFIDTGNQYKPPTHFDHHQDINLPASFVLVLSHFYPEIYAEIKDLPEIQHISDWDTRGPAYTMNKYNYRLPEFDVMVVQGLILDNIFSKATVIKPGDWLHEMLIAIGKEFLEKFRKLARELRELRDKAVTWKIKGLRVVMVDDTIAPMTIKRVFSDVAVVVIKNERNPAHYNLVRIGDNPRVDFNRIRDIIPAIFIHRTGFMAVVEKQYIEKALEIAIF